MLLGPHKRQNRLELMPFVPALGLLGVSELGGEQVEFVVLLVASPLAMLDSRPNLSAAERGRERWLL